MNTSAGDGSQDFFDGLGRLVDGGSLCHVVRTENTKVVGYSKVPQTKIL